MDKEENITTYEFFSEVFFYILILLLVFQKVLFKPLGKLSYMESKAILYTLVILALVGSILLLREYEKTGWDMLLTILFPFGLYSTLMSYQEKNYIKHILAITLVLTIMFVIAFIIRRLYSLKRILTRKYVFKVVCASQRIIAWGMCIVFVLTFTQELHDNRIFRLSDKSAVSGNDSGETIEKNIETIVLLQQNEWEQLDKAERLSVMQSVANIEANFLGLPHELHVQVENLSGGTLGTYTDSSHAITIDNEHIMNADSFEVLRTVLHESFHGYSHRLVDLYQLADEDLRNLKGLQSAKVYDEEFNSYTDPNLDYEEYYDMKSEEDARSYAENGIHEYCNRINEYLGIETELVRLK